MLIAPHNAPTLFHNLSELEENNFSASHRSNVAVGMTSLFVRRMYICFKIADLISLEGSDCCVFFSMTSYQEPGWFPMVVNNGEGKIYGVQCGGATRAVRENEGIYIPHALYKHMHNEHARALIYAHVDR